MRVNVRRKFEACWAWRAGCLSCWHTPVEGGEAEGQGPGDWWLRGHCHLPLSVKYHQGSRSRPNASTILQCNQKPQQFIYFAHNDFFRIILVA